MNNHSIKIKFSQLARLDRYHLRIALALLYLALIVLGIGAPGAGSDFGI